MDIVSLSFLWFFASALGGGLLGFIVGRSSRFELGLATGLFVVGVVALNFAVRCYLEYRDFAFAGANAAWGEVIAIEDRPANDSGSVTTPVPVVRFTAPDNVTHVVRGPSAGSATLGSHVNVIYDPADPQRSRIGQTSELRGGAIALLLFGSFPLSFAIWLLFATLGSGRDASPPPRARRQRGIRTFAVPAQQGSPKPGRDRGLVVGALNGALLCAILWIGLGPGELMQNFVQGFGAVAAICVGYALWGFARGRAGAAWNAGMLLLAVNFGVWAFALELLR